MVDFMGQSHVKTALVEGKVFKLSKWFTVSPETGWEKTPGARTAGARAPIWLWSMSPNETLDPPLGLGVNFKHFSPYKYKDEMKAYTRVLHLTEFCYTTRLQCVPILAISWSTASTPINNTQPTTTTI